MTFDIRSRREELRLTQREVAAACGVSEATISRWESGDIANMRRDKIAYLARVLRVSPATIAGIDTSGRTAALHVLSGINGDKLADLLYAASNCSQEDIENLTKIAEAIARTRN